MHAALARKAKGRELDARRQFEVLSPAKMGAEAKNVFDGRQENGEGKKTARKRVPGRRWKARKRRRRDWLRRAIRIRILRMPLGTSPAARAEGSHILS